MKPRDLLVELATDLWLEARDVVDAVYGGHRLPANQQALAAFVRNQNAPSPGSYHLPEPMLLSSGIVDRPAILVVGVNAGYGEFENMPTLESGLDSYINFFATRFDDQGRTRSGKPATSDETPRYNRHYGSVESLLVQAGFGQRALGQSAVYADAVPWKTKTTQGLPFGDPYLKAATRLRMERLLTGLDPALIIIPVLNASRWLADLLGAGDEKIPGLRRGAFGQWNGSVLAFQHHARWPTKEHKAEVIRIIREFADPKS